MSTSTVWVDHGVVPPIPLPPDGEAALAYLSQVLGHSCYERWTFERMLRVFVSLADAKKAKPAVFRLLLDHAEVVEWWGRGRLHTAPASETPPPASVLDVLVRAHGRRFRQAETVVSNQSSAPTEFAWIAAIDPQRSSALQHWLARSGRFVNHQVGTNTLAVTTDIDALTSFLRERSTKSSHTLRAYAGELRKLITWCSVLGLGPLSDLTRSDLLHYRSELGVARATTDRNGQPSIRKPSEATTARTIAVVASLYQYWHDTGYLIANPAAGLAAGSNARTFAPQRFLPAALIEACDAYVFQAEEPGPDLPWLRRRAIWALYRFAGVRLTELAWSIESSLPRLQADGPDCLTLIVQGKGGKRREIPLPVACFAHIRAYRVARGLPAVPSAIEMVPLIHGFKGGSLEASGLYTEVKAIFRTVADLIQGRDAAGASLLRSASPHWLRHAYAKSLVVDHKVPLPAAQSLLGHASVQTTAAYAKTDLSQLRTFVERSFP